MRPPSLVDQLIAQTSRFEGEVLRAVFSVPEVAFELNRSFVKETGGFLVCRFCSDRDAHCPFELHFGRGQDVGVFNMFVGAGAELANMESLATAEDAFELGEDVRRFMTSSVRCERYVNSGQVVREDYFPSEMSAGAAPLKLTYNAGGVFRTVTASRSTVVFSPWISAAE